MKTPFVFGKIASGTEFTDRDRETALLVQNFGALVNTVIISPRRWGKSSLVAKAAETAGRHDPSLRFCHIDLFNVRSEEEFYRQLAETVIRSTMPRWQEALEHLGKFLTGLAPKISLSPEPGTELTLDLDWSEVRKNPNEIIDLPERIAAAKGVKIVVCIDEFQNIAAFGDPLALQKKLRSHWQRHAHVSYCLFGSKRHMMNDVFTSVSMPFYKFGDILFLEKIDEAEWVRFIMRRFHQTRKEIDPATASRIARLCECHPFYVQQLAQHAWLRTDHMCSERIVDAAFDAMVMQLSLLFQTITDTLSTTQVNFLRAVTDGVTHFSAKDAIDSYGLGTSANVARIKQALVQKEIIENGGGGTALLDPLFQYWLHHHYFRRNA